MTRRDVLRAATVVPASAVIGTAANSAPAVGVIGTGERGTYVASLMAKNTPARVVALCDVVDEHMQRASRAIGVREPKLHKDVAELLKSDIDAVIIATPVYLHPEHFEAAVKAGKHIYIEKPAAGDVAGCRRIMRAADSADRRLNITFGFQRRYAEAYRKARAFVASGGIGSIQLAHAHFIKSEGSPYKGPGRTPPATPEDKSRQWGDWKHLSGDLIVENNVHIIDVMNWFLDAHPISAIGSGGSTRAPRGDMRDHNFIAYEYPNGVQGQMSGTTLAPRGYRHVVEQFFGDKGLVETSESHWRHFQGGVRDATEKAPREMTIDAVSEFVRRISEGKPENVAVRGAESTLTAILGRMAMDARREVTWDEMMRA